MNIKRSFKFADVLSIHFIFGLVDSSSLFSYALGILSDNWHYGTLFLKVLLIIAIRPKLSFPAKPAVVFAATILLLTVTSSFRGPDSILPYLQIFGFLVHFLITSAVIHRVDSRKYFAGVAACILAGAILHIGMYFGGLLRIQYGRPYYLGNSHPNLGGEIAAIGAFAAAYALRRPTAIIVIAILVIDAQFLQARSAVLACILMIGLIIIINKDGSISPLKITFAAFTTFILIAIAISANFSGSIFTTISDALFLNSEYRGIGSGASGRYGLWIFAIELFQQSPIFGYPPGYFSKIGYIGPHNIFLFGLSQYGLMSAFLFGAFLYGYVKLYAIDRMGFWLCVCLTPMLMFNDRLINLNSYPFIFYIMLFSIPSGSYIRKR